MAAIPPGFPIFATLPAGQQPLSLFDQAFVAVFDAITQSATGLTVNTTTIAGGANGRVLFDNNGILGEYPITGDTAVVMSHGATINNATLNAPALIGPSLGVATATSINGYVFTPVAAAALTIANGKILTSSATITLAGVDGKILTLTNSLTVSGNDGTLAFGAAAKTLTVNESMTLAAAAAGQTWAFPAVGSTVLTTGNTANLTKGFTTTPANLGTGAGTVTLDGANGQTQFITNNGAFTLAAPAADTEIDLLITNGATAGAITFSGFTVGSSTGSAFTTTNTNKFLLSVRRINGVATYSNYALQ